MIHCRLKKLKSHKELFSEWLSVSAPDCIYGENGIYDETGIKISESIVKSGNVHGVYSEDDEIYMLHMKRNMDMRYLK